MSPRPGLWPTLLTPFADEHTIDWDTFEQLIERYIADGAAGLFAVCYSSEAYQLSDQEKFDLARRTVELAAGRVQVVAGALSLGDLDHLVDHVRRLADTGVDAVVLNTSQLVDQTEGDLQWRAVVDQVVESTDSIPLGCYECPKPHHRLLSSDQLGFLARTGRFVFHKDTCCNKRQIDEKLKAVEGTPLQFFNANTPTLAHSLISGGDGYCGIGANFFPRLYALACHEAHSNPERIAPLFSFLSQADSEIVEPYPISGKVALRLCGVPITTFCRVSKEVLSKSQDDRLRWYLERAVELETSIRNGIPTPHIVLNNTPTDKPCYAEKNT